MSRWQGLNRVVTVALLMILVSGAAMAATNLIPNPGVENNTPFFWEMKEMGGTLTWATDEAQNGTHSLKIVKAETGSEASWITYDQAQTYWNGMSNTLYNISFWAKTDGVNTEPANDAAKIGGVWYFLDDEGNNIVDPIYTFVNQASATTDWTEYTNEVALTEAPAEAYFEVMMGEDATGTVWFDKFNIGSDPWTAGFFGDDVETPAGWLHWNEEGGGFAQTVDMEGPNGGSKVVKLEETDDAGDEMVFYSAPRPAEANSKYLVGVWVKTESVNTNDQFWPTDAMGTKFDDRANLCFFFHRGDIYSSWDVTGGDQFIYVDQTVESSEGWQRIYAIVDSPEDATGISMRARFNNTNTGIVYYDDFFCYKLETGDNLLTNGGLETQTPFFWNEGEDGGTLTWATDEALNGVHSLKMNKTATDAMASWYTDNQATTFWNNMGATLYSFSFNAKTEGVNTAPATDAAKIGAMWQFLDDAGANIIDPVYTWVNQADASTEWTEYTAEIALPSVPDQAICTVLMGDEATGTVWFDKFNIGSDPWTAGFFGDDVETVDGWMHWTDPEKIGYADVEQVEDAHGGDYVLKLIEEDNEDDEMVYYSAPIALEGDKWYEFSVWVKQTGMSPLSDNYVPSQVMTAGIAERANLCFFFHRGDIENAWDLTGGDQFIYFQQVAADSGWTQYRGAALAPEDATGASLRARFNNMVEGEIWFDDFMIREITPMTFEVGVDEPTVVGNISMPSGVALSQNYPNPFNSMTNISYVLPANGKVSLTVYDLLGREVARLVEGTMAAGTHTVTFRSEDLSSGVYFYRLSTENGAVVRKMMYLK